MWTDARTLRVAQYGGEPWCVYTWTAGTVLPPGGRARCRTVWVVRSNCSLTLISHMLHDISARLVMPLPPDVSTKALLGFLLWVDLIKWVSSFRPPVRTSVGPQSFFDFNEIWYAGRGRWVSDAWRYAVWPDPRSRSRSRGFERLSLPPLNYP